MSGTEPSEAFCVVMAMTLLSDSAASTYQFRLKLSHTRKPMRSDASPQARADRKQLARLSYSSTGVHTRADRRKLANE